MVYNRIYNRTKIAYFTCHVTSVVYFTSDRPVLRWWLLCVLSGACGRARIYNTLRKERMLLFYYWGKRTVLRGFVVLHHHLNNNWLTWYFEQILFPNDATSLNSVLGICIFFFFFYRFCVSWATHVWLFWQLACVSWWAGRGWCWDPSVYTTALMA